MIRFDTNDASPNPARGHNTVILGERFLQRVFGIFRS